MTFDINMVAGIFASDPRIILAVLFGSSVNGKIRSGSDVDLGVLLPPALSPNKFYDFYRETATRLSFIAQLDLIDLNHANNVLAFEALCGRRLFGRDDEAVAAFSSRVAREYEDDMLHVAKHNAAGNKERFRLK